MKVTKSYIKQVIKEELGRMEEATDELDRYLATQKGRKADRFIEFVYNKATELAELSSEQDMADLEEILGVIQQSIKTMSNKSLEDLEGRNALYDRTIESYGY